MECSTSVLFEFLERSVKDSLEISMKNDELPRVECFPDFVVEVPSNKAYGDFSTNAAMVCAKSFKLPPRTIAEILVKNFNFEGSLVKKCEIAGAGFINFFMDDRYYFETLVEIFQKKQDYGKNNIGYGQKVLVEYVSANPTGPMHMGNARGGAFGDCLASLLENSGYIVDREFYINDAGNQIVKFGISLDVRYQQVVNGDDSNPVLPQDCYQGDDIRDIAQKFYNIYKDKFMNESVEVRRKALVNFALPMNIEKIKFDLNRYRIHFDSWFSEKNLYKNKEIENVLGIYKKKNLSYEKDGALWLNLTSFGGEKDEVLLRSNGIPTYFLADIAYHKDKFLNRKYDICINLWGADHAGHVERMKNALSALGIDAGKLKIIIFQLVRLVKDSKVVKMSKRTGKAINLSDLLDEVPTDAVRFIFNMKDANSQMDFDLSKAVEKNMDNPVYYVQYAYARICSVLRVLEKNERTFSLDCIDMDKNIFKTEEERDLIKNLFLYKREIELAAKEYNPSRVMKHLLCIVSCFHRFYNACKVKCEEKDVQNSRLLLCFCTKIVIKNVLDIFKISAPETM